MDKTSADSAARDDGGGGGAGGGAASNKAGSKSDDDDDLLPTACPHGAQTGCSARIARQIRGSGMLWKSHARRNAEAQAVPSPSPSPASQGLKLDLSSLLELGLGQPLGQFLSTALAPPSSTPGQLPDAPASVGARSFTSADQTFLSSSSSTPPPSPAESGPSFARARPSPPIPSASRSGSTRTATGPATTIVSFVSIPPTASAVVPSPQPPSSVETEQPLTETSKFCGGFGCI